MKEREKSGFPQKCQKMEGKVTDCMRIMPGERPEIAVDKVRSTGGVNTKKIEGELVVWSNYQIGRA